MEKRAFSFGVGVDPDWRRAAGQCIHAITHGPSNNGLGFLYATNDFGTELDSVIGFLRQETGVEHWVGALSDAICAGDQEIYTGPAMAALVTDLQPEQYRLLPNITDSVQSALSSTREWRVSHGMSLGVVHGDPRNPRVPDLLTSLGDRLGNGFLVGGLCVGEAQDQQLADHASNGGLSGVLLGSDVPVYTSHTQGCALIGKRRVVTEADRNIIVSIDGKRALEVFREDIGELLARDLSKIGGYIFAALPLPGSDTGDYMVRNLLGIDEGNGLLAVGDYVLAGQSIQFARRDTASAVADLDRMLSGLGRRVGSQGVRGALYHTCLGRGRHQFGPDSRELKQIQKALGDIPLVGMFANGEIYHQRLYGYTGVLTLLG